MDRIPVLETTRLRLRAHTREDHAASARMWGDPEVVRFIGGVPSTPGEAWMRVLSYAGHWSLQGFGYWLVEERASGAFVGELGFADFRRALEPSILGIPEAGWALLPAMQGRGYAAEALAAALAWGDAHLGTSRTVCLIHPDHARSLRLAASAGYRELARTEFKGKPTILLERPRPRG